MSGKFSSLPYARALFEMGIATGNLDKWQSHLEKMAVLSLDPDVASFLTNPHVRMEDKSKVLSQALGEERSEVINLTCLIISQRAVNKLPDVAASYRQLMDINNGVERGQLITAVALGDEDMQDVSRSISKVLRKKVVLQSEVNKGLLGGFEARVAGKLFDGSTRSALAALKKELS